MATKMEFAVQMTCENCSKHIREALNSHPDVQFVSISLERGSVIVSSTAPISEIQARIESTGKKAVLVGMGGNTSRKLQSAVAILGGECGYGSGQIKGVIRFTQSNDTHCVIDGTVDGLTPGLHGLNVHEYGDISNHCKKVGNHFKLLDTPHGSPEDDAYHRHTGDLGNIVADGKGRAKFQILDPLLKVPDIIGRTAVITENADDLGKGENSRSKIDGNCGKKLACGIIARASGLFQNDKKICSCDGTTLWDENISPSL